MIRVLHVLQGLDAGGAETYVMNMYRDIDRSNIQFDFAVQKTGGVYEEEIRKMGGNIYVLPRFLFINSSSYEKKLKDVLNSNPDIKIVHSHNNSVGAFVARVAKKCGKVVVTHSHTNKNHISNWKDIVYKMYGPYTKKLFSKYAMHRFACSELAGNWQYGSQSSFLVKENAISIEKFLFDENERETIRSELGLDDAIVLGHVGRLEKVKNQKFLIEMFEAFYKKHQNAVLMIIGKGKLEKELKALAQKKGLDGSILFLGQQENIEKYYQAMDIFTLTSLYEGFPLTLIEAQAAGLPCVVSDRIGRESDLSGNIQYLPINGEIDKWCISIEKALHMIREKKVSDELNRYNSKDNAMRMQRFYLNCYNEVKE